MKVLILNNDLRVYWKGRLVYLHQFLASKNIDLYAAELFGQGSPYAFDPYNNKAPWWSCLFPDKSADQLSKTAIKNTLFPLLDKIDPDVIIGPSIVFYAGALGIRWAKKNRRKFIMFDDAKPSQFKRNPVVQWVKDTITAQADALWLPSADYDTEYGKFRQKGLEFIYGYSCINNDLFKFKEKKAVGSNTIITVARLVPIKNLDTLLRAWQIVGQTVPGSKLTIIGDGPERGNLEKLAAGLNLPAVNFAGAIANENIPAYFYHADAFILPSLSETWGLVVNEAMAARLPVLLSNKINACHTLLQEGVNGFSFEPESADDMAGAITKYLQLDIDAKEKMSANSLRIVNAMSYQNMGVNLYEGLTKIMAGKTKKTGVVAAPVMQLWYGKYDTSGWDKL